jgi:hypothetical protein
MNYVLSADEPCLPCKILIPFINAKTHHVSHSRPITVLLIQLPQHYKKLRR